MSQLNNANFTPRYCLLHIMDRKLEQSTIQMNVEDTLQVQYSKHLTKIKTTTADIHVSKKLPLEHYVLTTSAITLYQNANDCKNPEFFLVL